jgi:hypothetical protein
MALLIPLFLVPCGEVAHGAGGWASHHSLYGILVQGQNQERDNLEVNVTQSRRGLALR